MKKLVYKNIEISFTDQGKGTAVILLHGFLENQTMWEYFIAPLSERYRVITLDLLGHGTTGCLGYVHTMEDQADLVHHLLAELRIRKGVFIGHSMGGYVALAMAELFPEFIKGIALVNSTARADSEERKANRERAIKAVKSDYATFVRLSISNLFSEENRTKLEKEIELVKLQALKTPLQGIVAALEGMKMRKDREVLLHFTSFPKLLVLGKKDGVLDFEESATQTENTEVQLVAFPDGHMSHIENTTELLEVLFNYLRKM